MGFIINLISSVLPDSMKKSFIYNAQDFMISILPNRLEKKHPLLSADEYKELCIKNIEWEDEKKRVSYWTKYEVISLVPFLWPLLPIVVPIGFLHDFIYNVKITPTIKFLDAPEANPDVLESNNAVIKKSIKTRPNSIFDLDKNYPNYKKFVLFYIDTEFALCIDENKFDDEFKEKIKEKKEEERKKLDKPSGFYIRQDEFF